MHPDQITVPLSTVRSLVDEQFPEWRLRPVEPVESGGTVNALFRIGTELVARFPLQSGEPDVVRQWLEQEVEAARELIGRTSCPTPEPVAIGEPGAGYPLPWSVQTWLPGTVATHLDPGHSIAFADDLAEFIRSVRAIDTRGRTFAGRGRGGDLRVHDEWVQTCFTESSDLLDVPALRPIWAELRELPRTADDCMTHGDLIPGNVLVADDRLVGIIDVGGFGPADPALDLVGAWHLLESEARLALRDRLGCDDLEWARGKAWAFQQALGAVWYYVESNPTMSLMGRRTLERIVADSS